MKKFLFTLNSLSIIIALAIILIPLKTEKPKVLIGFICLGVGLVNFMLTYKHYKNYK